MSSDKPQMPKPVKRSASDEGTPRQHRGVQVRVCVITYLTSPYQVELFNEIAARGVLHLRVIYLRRQHDQHPWGPVELRHEHLVLDGEPATARRAFTWSFRADLTVCNYYTHWFALAALHIRHLSGRPWVFWGERPGFLKLGWLGRLGRKILLNPIAQSNAPVWAIGRSGVAGYRKDWGEDKVYVNLPYFSDLSRFHHQARATRAGECCVLYSGILNTRKGGLELAEGFKAAALEHPNLRLIILGSGPLEERMRLILAPLADRVSWEGFRQWSELPAYYARADVLCLPTRHDGWAMVVPEALASGLPVLTTREAGAAVELVEQGVNGWLMPAASAAEIASSLRHVATLKPDELAALSHAARESVKSHTLDEGGTRFIQAAHEAMDAFQCRLVGAENAGKPPTARLLITGSYRPDRLHSMSRYVHLVEEAAASSFGRVERVDPPVIFGGIRCLPARLRKLLAYLDKFVLFPCMLRVRATRSKDGQDCVVHVTDQGFGTVIPWIADFPVVVTIHDLIAVRSAAGHIPERSRAAWRGLFQRHILWALHFPCAVICVSRKTQADCEHLLGLGRDYHVVLNPLDPEFKGDTTQLNVPGLPAAFLLHVGNGLWYKNRPGVLKIYAELTWRPAPVPELVMMGDPPSMEERSLLGVLKIEDRVIWLSRPPTSWVMAAYDRATALIFPSLDEGFGWPVLEAMSRGCPVFTSNRPPLSEVGGEAVDYIDPENPETAAGVIWARLQEGDSWRVARSSAGRLRAQKFSVERFGEELREVYQSVLDRQHVKEELDLTKP